ncbi:MAG: iron dicitrate transport regulator FecR, partial [Cyanobacteria bacterium J06649_4]
LRIRPLTNPATRIEMYTPAGVSGVRGTDFGVAVGPDGQTGVATFEGRVASSAQGQTVTVNAQQQTIIRPGEPPTPPQPLRDDPTLFIETLRVLPNQVDAAGRALAQVVGSTDPANLLELNIQQRLLDREGRFDITLPVVANGRIPAVVTTPLGTSQKYELLVP